MISGVLVLLLFASALFLRGKLDEHRRHENRLHLFREASGVWPDFKSSEGEARAVQELGVDPSGEAQRMLIDLASKPPTFPALNSQREAIVELEKRNDPKIAPFLAGLIQIGTPIDTRQAAAQALQPLPCNFDCTVALLDYLDRIGSGEKNIEDKEPLDFGPEMNRHLSSIGVKEQQEIDGLIRRALLRDVGTTSKALEQRYSLGTGTPTEFGIAFATRTNRQEFCPALESSERQLQSSNPEDSTRQSLVNALKTLKCPVN